MRVKSLVLLAITGAALLPAATRPIRADPPADRVTITSAPLGRFGFGTGSGGMLWHSAIGHLVILQIQPGGPADKAGMHVGDEILEVDGLTVPGRARSEVFGAMRNKDAGKPVTFKVAADKGKGSPREVHVTPLEPSKATR